MLNKKKSYLIPIIGFAIIIFISSLMLYSPLLNYKYISYKDAMFTAISALTTTGYTKGSIVSQFNFAGQVVLAILMEIGALGFIIFISYIWSIKDKKIKMSDIIVISDNISTNKYGSIKKHSIFIVKLMIYVQLIGTILFSFKFIPLLGFFKGIWYSIFHTISAFSNTGMDLFGSNSLYIFKYDTYIQFIFIIIMLTGSIGIFVIEDLISNKTKKFEKLRLQTKIIVISTIILLLVPTIFFKLVEPETTIINCLFMSMTARSTGFSVVNLNDFSTESKVVLMILMIIGGSPTSTGGGVKMISIALIFATIIATLRGKNETIIFWKKVPDLTIKKAFTIFMLFVFILFITNLVFMHYNNLKALNSLFENISAITNTGLSISNLNSLNLVEEIIIMLLMFIGRVGPLSVILAFVREDKKNKYIKYPVEDLFL